MKTSKLINEMLRKRTFQATLGNNGSKLMKLNSELLQGVVSAPLLFSLYIATQDRVMENTDSILSNVLTTLGNYFGQWRLQPSLAKIEAMYSHLNNKLANKKLKIYFEKTNYTKTIYNPKLFGYDN